MQLFRDYKKRDWLIAAGIAVVYFFSARLGFTLAHTAAQVTTVWPPTGIALASVLLLGKKVWPGIFVGAFCANLFTGEPIWTAGIIGAGNTLEALFGAYLLRQVGFRNSLNRIKDVLALVFLAALLSTMLSATIGTLTLTAAGIIPVNNFGSVWTVWWVGDMVSNLLVAPLILCWAKISVWRDIKKRLVSLALLITLAASVSYIIFSMPGSSPPPIQYFIYPILVLAALVFQQSGVTLINLVVATAAVMGTISGRGPFNYSSQGELNLILLHSYLLISAATSMLLAGAISEAKDREEEQKRAFEWLLENKDRRTTPR